MNAIASVALWAAAIAGMVGAVSSRLRSAVIVAAVILWVDVAWLAGRLAVLDLSMTYVVDYARSGVGPIIRIAGLWGGPSGSLLLFAAGTATVAAAVRPARTFPVRALSAIVAVLAAAVAVDNPFRTLDIPAISGAGMQPILEHWAMIVHPPILYLGLVMSSGVWAHAVGGSGRRRVQIWALATFSAVTIGQLLGSNWAYVEVGWGGYWAWDPVENGIAVAWFVLVAALHAGRLPNAAQRAVAAGAWVAVLFAAFITRSGGGGSVHAFADDPMTGAILAVAVVATIGATAWGIRTAGGSSGHATVDTATRSWYWSGRRTIIVILALAAALVITVGLLYPVLAPGNQVVNGTYFARLIAPLGLMAVAGVGLSFIGWVGPRTGVVLGAGLIGGGALGAMLGADGAFPLLMSASVGLSVAGLIAGNYQRRRLGRPLRWEVVGAHLGVIVMGVGVAGSTQAVRRDFALQAGESFEAAGVVFDHQAVTATRDPEVERLTATIVVTANGNTTRLEPSVQLFPKRGITLAETAVISGPRRDIVVVMAGATELGLARYEVTITPLVQFVWWGAALIGVGALAAAGRRLYFSRERRRWASRASRVADSAR